MHRLESRSEIPTGNIQRARILRKDSIHFFLSKCSEGHKTVAQKPIFAPNLRIFTENIFPARKTQRDENAHTHTHIFGDMCCV